MGGGGDEVGGLLDGLAPLHDDPAPEREPGRPRARGPEAFAEPGQPPGGWGRPVACTLQAASQLLGVPPAAVRKAAAAVEPYRHANGTPRWSLMLLERALGQSKRGRVGDAWRGKSIRAG
jgi:hypothetical protein